MPPSATVYGLNLSQKGEVKRVKLCSAKESISLEEVQSLLKKKSAPAELGTYTFQSNTLTLFGYTEGKAGTENKHELPPPHDNLLCFGDILLVASAKSSSQTKPVTFTTEQQEQFQEKAFGGFEDLGEEDSGSESESESETEAEEDAEESANLSEKKKAIKQAVEEGEPEDEAAEAEEESLSGGDDNESEDFEGADVGGGEDGEDCDEIVAPKRASSKKKPVKTNLTVAQNTGRAKQQTLVMRPGFTEYTLEEVDHRKIPTDNSQEAKSRSQILGFLQKYFQKTFKAKQLQDLENAILVRTMTIADSRGVAKHFDNPLFVICYNEVARTLALNMNPKSYVGNQNLLNKVLSGDLQIEHLKTMTVQEQAPSIYNDLRERQMLREQNQLEGNRSMVTDMFVCKRCKKRETTQYELQTRSADEPMTKFITCVNCGNHWRK